ERLLAEDARGLRLDFAPLLLVHRIIALEKGKMVLELVLDRLVELRLPVVAALFAPHRAERSIIDRDLVLAERRGHVAGVARDVRAEERLAPVVAGGHVALDHERDTLR